MERKFTKEEMVFVKCAIAQKSEKYGKQIKILTTYGTIYFMPIYEDSTIEIGDILDLSKCLIIDETYIK